MNIVKTTTLFCLMVMTAPAAVSADAGMQHEHEHEMSMTHDTPPTGAETPLTHTPEIDAAIAAGGTPLVADVLGVVCDFCATAMNKIFGGREEVAAVYVDLDTKALNLVIKAGQSLDDETIGALAIQAGYRIAQVHRRVDTNGES